MNLELMNTCEGADEVGSLSLGCAQTDLQAFT